jgi:hypothetical protein
LEARGGDGYNSKRARLHLPASILSKPVGLLRAAELCKWRDGLIEKGLARDTVNRVRTCLRAALSLAARRDRRIANRHVWEDSRALLRGISITLVADATDTSEKEIRRHYAKLISDHSGEIMRRALLDVSQPSIANVVALPGRGS